MRTPIISGDRYVDQVFPDTISFKRKAFKRATSFAGATFEGHVDFSEATFAGNVWFDGATFERSASFAGATFLQGAFFGGSTFLQDADFREANFLGPAFGRRRFTVVGGLRLTGSRFAQAANLVLGADAVDCVGTQIDGGGVWELRWAEVDLRRAVVGGLLIISHDTHEPHDDERVIDLSTGGAIAANRRYTGGELARRRTRSAAPRVVSLDAADVGQLVLSRVDLRACRFAGAHNLDQLRTEECLFPTTPGWTGRLSISEEHQWRAARNTPLRRRSGWYEDEHRPPGQIAENVQSPPHIAALYRALRKGVEDRKDQPGAGDFYYGEMEMRRHAPLTGGPGRRVASWFERVTIWLYWALSGYALRPSRALLSLSLLVIVAGGAFHQYGFVDVERPFDPTARAGKQVPPPNRFPDSIDEAREAFTDGNALIYSISTAAAFAPLPDARLTPTGRTIRTLERILGPILLGLVLLSIRGRVKR